MRRHQKRLSAIGKRTLSIVFLLLISLNGGMRLSASSVGIYGSQYTWIYRCNRLATKTVALTFDDGPHPTLTGEILAILREYHIPATFFVIGENVRRYPRVLREILADGHEIGNHTYTHVRPDKTEKSVFSEEISSCSDVIRSITQKKPTLFRPPEGAINDQVREIAGELGYRIVLWSIDTEDWRHTPADDIVRRVTKDVRDGDIILMHDYIGRGSPTPEALKKMIPALIARGYRFVLVSELLNIGTTTGESEVNR
jgi:polysaccharide deacetylase family sporulation protein PdaB